MSEQNSNAFLIGKSDGSLIPKRKFEPGVWGGFNNSGLLPIKYNGVDVYFVSESFVKKGYGNGNPIYQYPKDGGSPKSNGNSNWYGNSVFLNDDVYSFLKPAKLSDDFVEEVAKVTPYVSAEDKNNNASNTFDMRDVPDFKNGFIIEKEKFNQISENQNTSSIIKFPGSMWVPNPARMPDRIGLSKDGVPSYIGYTADTSGSNQRYDLLAVNGKNEQSGGEYDYKWSKSILNVPAFRLLDAGFRIVNPWYNLVRSVGDFAFNDGKIGDVALAAISLNTPNANGVSAAQGTFLEIPQIASATSKMAQFFQSQGLTASQAATAAKITFDTGISYMAEGGSLSDAFTRAAATYVGSEVAGEVLKFVGPLNSDLTKITKATTTAATRATLLNEDVSLAAKKAFITTSVPIAIDGALKESGLKLSQSARSAAINFATQSALNPNADTSQILRKTIQSTLTDAVYDKVKSSAIKSGKITADNTEFLDRLKNGIKEVIDGKDPTQVLVGNLVDIKTSLFVSICQKINS